MLQGKAKDEEVLKAREEFTPMQAKWLQAVEELKAILPHGMTMPQFALKWILMHDAVSCAIPGAKRPSQVEENCRASEAPRLSRRVMRQVQDIYDRLVKEEVHQRW